MQDKTKTKNTRSKKKTNVIGLRPDSNTERIETTGLATKLNQTIGTSLAFLICDTIWPSIWWIVGWFIAIGLVLKDER